MAIAVTLTHISQRLEAEVVALGPRELNMALHIPRWATREREEQFALFSDVVIHRYKFSNRPFCVS